MATDRIQMQNLRSAEVLSGSSADISVAKHFDNVNSPKLPTSDQLEFGEIALNIATGYEVIAIKNYDGEVVYIPFNIATRLLKQEVTLKEFKASIITDFELLRHYTEQEIDKFRGLHEEELLKLESLSGDVYSLIEGLEDDFNDRFNSLSANTKEEIVNLANSFSGQVQTTEDRLNSTITSLSTETKTTTDELIAKVNTLSGETNGQINDVYEYIDEAISHVSSGGSEALDELTEEFHKSYSALSKSILDTNIRQDQETDAKIQTLSGNVGSLFDELNQKINNVASASSAYTDTEIIKLSASTAQQVAELIDRIGDVASDLEQADININSKIDSLSAETSSGITSINSTINSLSGDIESKTEGLKQYVDEKVSGITISGVTEEVKELIHAVENKEDDKINKITYNLGFDTNYDFVPEHDALSDKNVTQAIDFIFDTLLNIEISGTSKSEIEALEKELTKLKRDTEYALSLVDNRITNLSSTAQIALQNLTDTVIALRTKEQNDIDDVYDAISNLSTSTRTDINKVNQSFNSLSAETISKLDGITEFIKISDDALQREILQQSSAYTDFRVAQATSGLSQSISALTKGEEALNEYIDNKITGVKGEVDVTNNQLKEFSGTTLYNLTEIGKAILYTQSAITEVQEGLIDNINALSAATDDKIDKANNTLKDEISASTSSLSGNLKTYIDTQDNLLNTKIETLSAETDNKINNLKVSDLSDVDDTVKPISSSTANVLTKTEDGWEVKEIGHASSNTYGIVKVGSGLTSDNGTISVIPIQIDSDVNSGSTNAVAGGAVYGAIKHTKDELEQHITDVEHEYQGVAIAYSGLSQSFDELSANTETRLSGFNESISAFTSEIRAEFEESDLVRAAAIAKHNLELGFNVNGEFDPESSNLQGRNVTGALDYLDNKVSSYEDDCQERYDNLEEHVIKDEEVHAGYAAIINNSLGFDVNANYVPEAQILKGRNVTDAIDFLYGKVEEDILINVESGKTSVYNQVTNDIATVSANTYAYISGETTALSGAIDTINEYLASEQSALYLRSITYEHLVELRDSSNLRPGVLYRLTNYQATVPLEGTTAITRKSVVTSTPTSNNDFDILIRAISNNTLDENVTFAKPARKSYFEDCAVSSWKGKYTIDNDVNRFGWAVPDGFGVIFYMQDNYGNEAPYDFKNIKFRTFIAGITKARFTFHSITGTDADVSMYGSAHNNIIKPVYDSNHVQQLNEIICVSDNCYGNEFAAGCQNIVLFNDCVDNKLSPVCNGKMITDKSHGLLGYTIETV